MSDNNPPADHTFVDGDDQPRPIEDNIKSGATWLRGLFMLISTILMSVAMFAGTVIVVLGFFYVLFTGEVKQPVRQAGQAVAAYIYQIARYLTYNSDEKPFPLGGEWPSADSEGENA